MNKISFSTKERRVIIVLMIINCFALFVNLFQIDVYTENTRFIPRNEYRNNKEVTRYHFFTDRNPSSLDDGMFERRSLEYRRNSVPIRNFYPFVSFTSSNIREPYVDERTKALLKETNFGYDTYWKFRGLFPYYDFSEFVVYSMLIFGIPIMRKLWKKPSVIDNNQKIQNEGYIYDDRINSLKDLKERGILTEEEYSQKSKDIENSKLEAQIKESSSYKKLKSLYDDGVLTKEEFEIKVEIFKKSSKQNS